MITCSDLDALVEKTYGRTYCFQQQDDCKDRGVENITVPVPNPYDFEATEIPEKINGDVMGVSFAAWLARDPDQGFADGSERNYLGMFWERNFYPSVDMVVNDLHQKGLLPAGDYAIKIDW